MRGRLALPVRVDAPSWKPYANPATAVRTRSVEGVLLVRGRLALLVRVDVPRLVGLVRFAPVVWFLLVVAADRHQRHLRTAQAKKDCKMFRLCDSASSAVSLRQGACMRAKTGPDYSEMPPEQMLLIGSSTTHHQVPKALRLWVARGCRAGCL